MIFIVVVLWLKLKVTIHDPSCTNHRVVRGRRWAVVWCWNSFGHRIGITTLSTKHRFTECWRTESTGMLLNCVWCNNIHLVLFSALQLYVIVAVLLFCLQVYWDAPLFTNLMIFISVKWQIYYQVHMYLLIVWHISDYCFMGMPIGSYVTAVMVKEIHR